HDAEALGPGLREILLGPALALLLALAGGLDEAAERHRADGEPGAVLGHAEELRAEAECEALDMDPEVDAHEVMPELVQADDEAEGDDDGDDGKDHSDSIISPALALAQPSVSTISAKDGSGLPGRCAFMVRSMTRGMSVKRMRPPV